MGCLLIVSPGTELPPPSSAPGTAPWQPGQSSGGAAQCQDTRSARCHQRARLQATSTLQGYHRCCHVAGIGTHVAMGMYGAGQQAQHPGLCASPV